MTTVFWRHTHLLSPCAPSGILPSPVSSGLRHLQSPRLQQCTFAAQHSTILQRAGAVTVSGHRRPGLREAVADLMRGAQVIGLESAGRSFLALTNLWRKIHGRRLAQGSEFLIEMAKGSQRVSDPSSAVPPPLCRGCDETGPHSLPPDAPLNSTPGESRKWLGRGCRRQLVAPED